ncbi:enkurin isoform X1 [Elgaria multicarinata webbii]|uniref:enkurin isoform X1 n=1 Tax=Elgaria multicarinata webbii TaxID=159646 RepID=UPI002FCCE4BF
MAALCMEESIYNLLPEIVEKTFKAPRYVSTFKPYVKHTIQQSKAPWKTIGPAKVEVPNPKDFLQKHSKEPKLPKRGKDRESKKMTETTVPKITEHPLMGIQCTKNFVSTNAANVIMGVSKKPQPVCVDRRQGDKFLLETSGLVPKYLKKKNYGLTPKYVTKRNEEAKRAQEEYDAYVKETLRQKAMKRLTEEERESLLEALLTGRGVYRIVLLECNPAHMYSEVSHIELLSGSQEELGRSPSGIPKPFSRNRYNTKEASQRKAGNTNKTVGT